MLLEGKPLSRPPAYLFGDNTRECAAKHGPTGPRAFCRGDSPFRRRNRLGGQKLAQPRYPCTRGGSVRCVYEGIPLWVPPTVVSSRCGKYRSGRFTKHSRHSQCIGMLGSALPQAEYPPGFLSHIERRHIAQIPPHVARHSCSSHTILRLSEARSGLEQGLA